MTIHIVAARAKNNVIGKGREIPWKVKGEQKLFKEITLGGTLIMGRVTFESIGRPLPGRTTIIVTKNRAYTQTGCEISFSIESAIKKATIIDKPIYIVGGGELYKQSLNFVDVVHLTTIDCEAEGDIFFPEFPTKEFTLHKETHFQSNINYTYQEYRRIADIS